MRRIEEFGIELCPDCNGEQSLGRTHDTTRQNDGAVIRGKQVACETCGGHEDALGTGFVLTDSGLLFQELPLLIESHNKLESALALEQRKLAKMREIFLGKAKYDFEVECAKIEPYREETAGLKLAQFTIALDQAIAEVK